MARLTERQLARLLERRFRTASSQIRLGIGDDAAVLAAGADDWVCSVDASVEGVHFDRRYLSLVDVGYRSFQAAASDLAAMGAVPIAALSALILPRTLSDADVDQLTVGQARASEECGCPIVGGNISRGEEISITTTVIGSGRAVLRRDGARPGNELWLVGTLGCAAAGLSHLRLEGDARPQRLAVEQATQSCVQAWRRPRALLEKGRSLLGLASAAIDISDGLATDALQLARASGVCVIVDQEKLRATFGAPLLVTSRRLRRSALHFALYGGEDYALLATGPRSHRPPWARAIGYVTAGAGTWLSRGGERCRLGPGYDHRGG